MTATAGRPATEYTVEGFDDAPHPGVEVARGGTGPSTTSVRSDTAALLRASLEAAGAFAPHNAERAGSGGPARSLVSVADHGSRGVWLIASHHSSVCPDD